MKPPTAEEIKRVQLRVGVPLNYQNARDVTANWRKNVYLYGPTGTGKTWALACLTNAAIDDPEGPLHKAAKRAVSWENLLIDWRDAETRSRMPNIPVRFLSVSGLVLQIKATFRRDSPYSESEVVGHYATCPYLFLDDWGVQLDTDWSLGVLDHIIDQRWANGRHLAITSNLDPAKLIVSSDRLASRLAGMCGEAVCLSGKDRRLT